MDPAGSPDLAPILAPHDLDRLRSALAPFTVDGVHELLGPVGRGAQSRGDTAGVARCVRGAAADDARLATTIELFLLGADTPEADARRALAPLPLGTAVAAGLIEVSAGAVRARLDVRPYAEDGARDEAPWWVVSDLGSDVRPGPLAADHVLGVGAAALTLAQATPRVRVERALDVGTGCGVQALHLGRHCGHVTATDISVRALRLAATTAALSGQSWDLVQGSFLEPVAGRQRHDLVVANPPFVVSPGTGEHDYRDSGLAGDRVCSELVGNLPDVLAPGGTAQLLANWMVPTDGSWQERVAGWFDGGDCDAWVWQRETADLGEYVAMWLRDAGHVAGTPDWAARYDAWTDWFVAHGVAAVGMGLITMWRGGSVRPIRVLEDVPQAVEQPVGGELAPWLERQRWLAGRSDDDLLRETLHAVPELVRTRRDLLGTEGWATRQATLRQSHGMRWEIEVDDAVATLVAACDAGAPAGVAVELLAAVHGADTGAGTVDAAAAGPLLRDLVSRGLLLPGGRR